MFSCQVMFKQLMTPEFFLPPKLQKDYPSHIRINLMARAQGQGIAPRMVSTVLSTLKAKGEWVGSSVGTRALWRVM